MRTLQRPELDGGKASTWRQLRGPDRRPPQRPHDAQEQRIAAWLELVYWWRFAFPACAAPPAPWLASRCVKLVAEPGRIWLALEHGERVATRAQALQRLLRRLPEEEAALREVIALERALPRSPEPALATVIPVLLRLSERIAATLAAQIADAPVTEVALSGERDAAPAGGLACARRPARRRRAPAAADRATRPIPPSSAPPCTPT